MALYAFDGTWNENQPGDKNDTNVRKFYEAYRGRNKWYREGVGTEWGPIGKVIGGLFGAGGKKRVEDGYKELTQVYKNGDRDIDIVGFSRGSALALDFANKIAEEGVAGDEAPKIRFLGVWDVVGSFGLPGNHINLGYQLTVPRNVRKCFHALALDERRRNFTPERLGTTMDDAEEDGRLYEVWFRGVHSDVGGGNKNNGLSSIALTWMFSMAALCQVPLDEEQREQHRRMRNEDAAIRPEKVDPIKNPFRPVKYHDAVHESVRYRAKTGGLEHNNPPKNLSVVGDKSTNSVGKFKRP